MERAVASADRQAYATAVTGLWERIGSALTRLERIASAPADWLADDALDELPRLQYTLHAGAELAHGIRPPRGEDAVHEELVAALAHARDATADVATALEIGGLELLQAHLPEWRGALFRVRLARLRALERAPMVVAGDGVTARPLATPAPGQRPPLAAIAASVLVLCGGLLFTAGAVLAAWPLWAAGLLLVGGGFALHRP